MPVIAGESAVDQCVDRIAEVGGANLLLGRLFPARQHVQFGTGKVEAGNRPNLISLRHGEFLQTNCEDLLTFGDQRFQIGAGDFDVDGSPAAQRTFKQAGLADDGDDSRHLRGGTAQHLDKLGRP